MRSWTLFLCLHGFLGAYSKDMQIRSAGQSKMPTGAKWLSMSVLAL